MVSYDMDWVTKMNEEHLALEKKMNERPRKQRLPAEGNT
jgi:hypothetical protein